MNKNAGPSSANLSEFFPPSPPRNAWTNGASSLPVSESQHDEQDFPCVCRSESKSHNFLQKGCRKGSSAPLRRASAITGLIPNARKERRSWVPNNVVTSNIAKRNKNPCPPTKEEEDATVKFQSAEAFLRSRIPGQLELDTDVIRDILDEYNGDVKKSLEALEQMATHLSSVSIESSLQSVRELDRIHAGELQGKVKADEKNLFVSPIKANVEMKAKFSEMKANMTQKLDKNAALIYNELTNKMLMDESSSMKRVFECLKDKFPQVDPEGLVAVLQATNFDCGEAEMMLLEGNIDKQAEMLNGETESPHELSKVLLESLFFKKKEEVNEEESTKTARKPFVLSKAWSKPKEVKGPNWNAVTSRDIIESNSQSLSLPSGSSLGSYGDWNDYGRHRESSKQHWKTMESYLKAATAAYAKGDPVRGDILTEKADWYKKLSLEAKERANNCLLNSKTFSIENGFILNVGGQCSGEVLKLLKMHLRILSPIPSCHDFTIVIGDEDSNIKFCDEKVRDAVIDYLEENDIEWIETRPFHIIVKLRKPET